MTFYLAFIVGTAVAYWRARAAGIPRALRHIACLAVITLVAALVGAHLAFVAVEWRQFANNLRGAFFPFNDGTLRIGGLVFNGGLLLASATALIYLRLNRLPVLKALDVIAPSVAIGECIGRMGCFLGGCCYGVPTAMPWGVIFPPNSPAGYYQRLRLGPIEGIHPTQIYSSLLELAIFIFLLAMERRGKRFDGATAFSFLMLYGAARFTVECFRHFHNQSGMWFGLTHNQYLSIVLFLGSAGALIYLQRTQDSKLTMPPSAEESTAERGLSA